MRITLQISVLEKTHLFRDNANARGINSLQETNGKNDLHFSSLSWQACCSCYRFRRYSSELGLIWEELRWFETWNQKSCIANWGIMWGNGMKQNRRRVHNYSKTNVLPFTSTRILCLSTLSLGIVRQCNNSTTYHLPSFEYTA